MREIVNTSLNPNPDGWGLYYSQNFTQIQLRMVCGNIFFAQNIVSYSIYNDATGIHNYSKQHIIGVSLK